MQRQLTALGPRQFAPDCGKARTRHRAVRRDDGRVDLRIEGDEPDAAEALRSLAVWLKDEDGLRGQVRTVPRPMRPGTLGGVLDAIVVTVGQGGAGALAVLRSDHPDALGTPRQQARFLSGITSPATSRAKLTKHGFFGSLAERRFAHVLAWCESIVA